MITDIKNPRWADEGKARIIVDCKLPDGETAQFVASPTDCVSYGRDIFKDCKDGKYGTIADFVPPVKSPEEIERLAQDELDRRLKSIMTPENQALAEIDDDFKTEYKGKIKALLDVKQKKGWPDKITWPDETQIQS